MFTTEKAKKKLLDKFSAKNLEYTILEISKLRTKQIEGLELSELKELYYLFFPLEKPKTAIQRLSFLENEQQLRKYRSAILKDAEYLGIYTVGDWKRFNGFMLNKSVFKKPLNKYEIEEFTPLLKQFKSMKSKFDKNKIQVGTSEWYSFVGVKPSLN